MVHGTACRTPWVTARGISHWVVLENAGVEPAYSKPSQAAQMTQQNVKTISMEELFKDDSWPPSGVYPGRGQGQFHQSQIASEKMNLIHTKLWPSWVSIMPWSLETGSCLARSNGGGLKYLRNYRAAHKAWTSNFTQGRFGQGLQLPASRSTLMCWRDAARAPLPLNEHVLIRREASHLRNQRWGQWKEKTQLDRKSIAHAHLSPGSFLHPFPSL